MSAFSKVTIVGAGQVGATTALLLLQRDLADVTLIDIAEGLPQGKALDLMHMRSLDGFGPRIVGTNDYADTAGSDIVVITAGVPRKPGMTRADLLEINSGVLGSVVESVVEHSPDAVLIVVTNPLDVMTYLAAQRSGLPRSRVMGMGGVLDSARCTFAISEATGAPVSDIDAMAIGAHGDAMVPLTSRATIGGTALADAHDGEVIDAISERTVFGGAEVVSLLKTGSAFYAPAASIAKMVEAILTDSGEVMSVAAYLEGEYGVDGIYMCVPVELGRKGIHRIVELDLDDSHIESLQASADVIAEAVDSLGLRDR